MSRRTKRSASLVFVCCVGAFACAGGPADSGERAGSSAHAATGASGVIAQEKIDRCAGLTAAEVAPFIGAPASNIETSSEKVHSTLRMCGYAARSGEGVVSFSLSWEPSVEAATAGFAGERADLGLANRATASAGQTKPAEASYVDVLGLGEDAFWTAVNDTTVTRVGNVRVQIMMPSDRQKQTAIAQLVVKGLK